MKIGKNFLIIVIAPGTMTRIAFTTLNRKKTSLALRYRIKKSLIYGYGIRTQKVLESQ